MNCGPSVADTKSDTAGTTLSGRKHLRGVGEGCEQVAVFRYARKGGQSLGSLLLVRSYAQAMVCCLLTQATSLQLAR
jgi:hypothetical protein